MKRVVLACTTGMLTVLTACGSTPTASQNAQVQTAGIAAQSTGGNFVAQLRPLNAQVNGQGVTGTATFSTANEMFSAMVDARHLSPGLHVMHIHAFNECPTRQDDANGDHIVDVIEGVPDYGPILIPLDSDLSDQAAGTFTNADMNGMLHYSASTSLSALMADLYAPDPNSSDAVVKLQPGEALNLAGRHVVIHGVEASTPLPGSVATLGSIPSHITLPVACGEIKAHK